MKYKLGKPINIWDGPARNLYRKIHIHWSLNMQVMDILEDSTRRLGVLSGVRSELANDENS